MIGSQRPPAAWEEHIAALDGEGKESLARRWRLCPRCVAVGVIIDARERILLEPGHDPHKGELFYRLPGGGVHFGEPAAHAVEREIGEELGWRAQAGEHLATFENHFTFDLEVGHEVVFVYRVKLLAYDPRLRADDCGPALVWRNLEETTLEKRPIYPAGAEACLRALFA